MNARFNYPADLVVDPQGNLYINDANNYTIRKMTAAGVVTTIAGSPGVRDYVDGAGSAARFFQPRGLARDSAGNLYITDFSLAASGTTVRRISPSGVVSTYLAISAHAVAVDSHDTLLVAGSTLRAFAANGSELFFPWPSNLPTPGGVPIPPIGNFGTVHSLTIDSTGNVYVVDLTGSEIRKITPARVMTTLAGAAGVAGYADGSGASARFNYPNSAAIDAAGNVYVGDGNNSALRKITPAGVVTTAAGAPGAPPLFGSDGTLTFPDGTAARLSSPRGIAIGADGTIYFLDLNTVRKAAPEPAAAKIVTPPEYQTLSAGDRATFSVVAVGYPAVTFQWQRLSAKGETWSNLTDGSVYGGTTTAVLTIGSVTSAMNGDRYRCVVANSLATVTSGDALLTVDPPVVIVPLRITTLAGHAPLNGDADGGGAAARFNGPTHVACDASGNLYVSDHYGNRIRKITPSGTVTTLAGSGLAGTADGTGQAAQFRQPGPLAIDVAGNIYVADQPYSPYGTIDPTIRKITPQGVVTTFAHSPSGRPLNITGLAIDSSGQLIATDAFGGILRFNASGVPASVTVQPAPGSQGLAFDQLAGLALDRTGNYYIADSVAHAIFRVTPAGVLSLVAGVPRMKGAVDGRANVARFNSPRGIAVDATGNIYVTEAGNETIRRISTAGVVSTVASIKSTAAVVHPVGTSDGVGVAARFNSPWGLAFDRAGVLYIADSHNHTIRRGIPVDSVGIGQSAEFYAQKSIDDSISITAGEGIDPARAAATNGPLYRWFKDGTALPGATEAELRIASASRADQGTYAVQIITADGEVTSPPIAFSVVDSRLNNLSIRASAGAGNETLIVGFVVEGGGLPMLVRGVGPGLQPFGVAGTLPRPWLALYAGQTALAANAGWAGDAGISEAAKRVGAFSLESASRDAALLSIVDIGAFTAQCGAEDETKGVALVELYDASVAVAGRSRLVNLSARSAVGAGDNIMIAGFAISGSSPRRLLIRGVGPTLEQFAITNALADPQLKVFDAAGALHAQNDNWNDTPSAIDIRTTAETIGAFALPTGSKDAALLLTLGPSTYTVHLSGAASSTGIALIEIYEAP